LETEQLIILQTLCISGTVIVSSFILSYSIELNFVCSRASHQGAKSVHVSCGPINGSLQQ
jgi:hypothetical protein